MPPRDTTDPNIDLNRVGVSEASCRRRVERIEEKQTKNTEAILHKIDTLRIPLEEVIKGHAEHRAYHKGVDNARADAGNKISISTKLISVILTAVALLAAAMVYVVASKGGQ